MTHALAWFLVILALEVFIAIVMLGAWVVEGRRRAEEMDRLDALLRPSAEPGEHPSRR